MRDAALIEQSRMDIFQQGKSSDRLSTRWVQGDDDYRSGWQFLKHPLDLTPGTHVSLQAAQT